MFPAGLGDALGVDWASLVADVHRREQITPSGGARDRWRPEKVLTRVGLSIQMAGKELVQNILDKNAETDKELNKELNDSPGKSGTELNGTHKKEEEQQQLAPNVDSLHPVAAIQVSCLVTQFMIPLSCLKDELYERSRSFLLV